MLKKRTKIKTILAQNLYNYKALSYKLYNLLINNNLKQEY